MAEENTTPNSEPLQSIAPEPESLESRNPEPETLESRLPESRLPPPRLGGHTTSTGRTVEQEANEKDRILNKKIILQQKILEVENTLSEQWDQIIHFADLATREVTSSRIKHDLDNPKKDVPFILDLIIYFAIGAIPFGSILSSTYIASISILSKMLSKPHWDFARNKAKIKAFESIRTKLLEKYKNSPSRTFYSNRHMDEKIAKLSHMQKYVDLINSSKFNSLFSAFTTSRLRNTITKSIANDSTSARNKEYMSLMDTFRQMAKNSGTAAPITFKADVQFYKEIYDSAQMNKLLIKNALQFQRATLTTSIDNIPEKYLDEDIKEVDYLLDKVLFDSEDRINLPPHLNFESATIGGMELIIWARMYNWSYSPNLKALDTESAFQKPLYYEDRKFSPDFGKEKQFDYFKGRFINSGFKIPFGKFVESKNNNVPTNKETQEKILFYQYMERLSKSLLDVQEDMTAKIKLPSGIPKK